MTPTGHDPDDWFDEPETPGTRTDRIDRLARERQAPSADVDDWVTDSAPRAGREFRRPDIGRRGILLALLVLALFFGILAVAGVFSGGSRPSAVTTTTPTVSRPTTTATTPATPRAPVVPTTPLKPGDAGAAVTQLQRALTRAGYSPGAADGSYGSATAQAVTRFQQAHGLTADGVAGPKTLAALTSALQSG